VKDEKVKCNVLKMIKTIKVLRIVQIGVNYTFEAQKVGRIFYG